MHSTLEKFVEQFDRKCLYTKCDDPIQISKAFVEAIKNEDEVVFDVINSPFYSNFINWSYVVPYIKKSDFTDRISIPLYARYMHEYADPVRFINFIKSDSLDQQILDDIFLNATPNGCVKIIKNSKYFSDSIHRSILKFISKKAEDPISFLNILFENETDQFIRKSLDFIIDINDLNLFSLVIKIQNINFSADITEKILNFMIEHNIRMPIIRTWPKNIFSCVKTALKFKNDLYLSIFVAQKMLTSEMIDYIIEQKYIPGITMLANKGLIKKFDTKVYEFLCSSPEYELLFEFDPVVELQTVNVTTPSDVDIKFVEKIIMLITSDQERVDAFKKCPNLHKHKVFFELFCKYSSDKNEFLKNVI